MTPIEAARRRDAVEPPKSEDRNDCQNRGPAAFVTTLLDDIAHRVVPIEILKLPTPSCCIRHRCMSCYAIRL